MIDNFKMSICSQHTLNLNLTLYYCGSKICREETWEPEYMDNYTMFYLFSGEGEITLGHQIFHVEEGEGFLVPPRGSVAFQALNNSACEIAWIGFYGLGADSYLERCGLHISNPVFKDTHEEGIGQLFLDILKDSQLEHNRYCRITASLYLIFSRLLDLYDLQKMHFGSNTTVENYIKQAMNYVNSHYMDKISVNDMANHVGIDRKYLHFIFKKKLDIGPQQYIKIFRLHRACIYLSDTDRSIASISKAVGYENPLNFSKMFKKTFDMSPKEYRKNPTFIKYNMVTWGKILNETK